MTVQAYKSSQKYETFSYLPPMTADQVNRQIAYAIGQGWNPAVEHIAHHMPEPALLEPAHAVPKCADARQHDFFRARNLRGIGGQPHVRAERF